MLLSGPNTSRTTAIEAAHSTFDESRAVYRLRSFSISNHPERSDSTYRNPIFPISKKTQRNRITSDRLPATSNSPVLFQFFSKKKGSRANRMYRTLSLKNVRRQIRRFQTLPFQLIVSECLSFRTGFSSARKKEQRFSQGVSLTTSYVVKFLLFESKSIRRIMKEWYFYFARKVSERLCLIVSSSLAFGHSSKNFRGSPSEDPSCSTEERFKCADSALSSPIVNKLIFRVTSTARRQ